MGTLSVELKISGFTGFPVPCSFFFFFCLCLSSRYDECTTHSEVYESVLIKFFIVFQSYLSQGNQNFPLIWLKRKIVSCKIALSRKRGSENYLIEVRVRVPSTVLVSCCFTFVFLYPVPNSCLRKFVHPSRWYVALSLSCHCSSIVWAEEGEGFY